MTPVFYDLHIHSCLSPCADNDMTPQNIVNMSLLKELDMIALTDHNSCKNCPALLQAAKGSGLAVIPGMELTTAEEIHMVCLFSSLENAMAFDSYVHARLADVENVPKIFGEQLIVDALENIIGSEEKLLVNATTIGISELPSLMRRFGGLCYPAHIDRSSYSVLSNLGGIPPECGFKTLEVYMPDAFFADGAHADIQAQYYTVTSSDAHDLARISEREHCIHLHTVDFYGLAARLL
ncbi:PHP domain-containing protein [Oscillospiraceae bacterium PP1C4]